LKDGLVAVEGRPEGALKDDPKDDRVEDSSVCIVDVGSEDRRLVGRLRAIRAKIFEWRAKKSLDLAFWIESF
jgi:hypothetical protein